MIQGCQQKWRRSVFFNKLRAQQCGSLSDSNGADSDIKVCLLLTCDFSVCAGGRINEHRAFFTTSQYYERSTTFFFFLPAGGGRLSCSCFACVSVTSVKSYFGIICQLQNDDVNAFSVVESVQCFGGFFSFFFFSVVRSPLLHQHLRAPALPQEESQKTRDFISGAVTVC